MEVTNGEIKYSLENRLVKKLDIFIDRCTREKRKQNAYLANHGKTGCLAGDTIIRISRVKGTRSYTIKEFYIKHKGLKDNKNKRVFDKTIQSYIRSFNGEEIRLHKIKDIVYSGKKLIYLLKLTDGKKIKATADHKFLTRYGWKELRTLKIDEEIMCDKPKPEKNGRKKIKLRDIWLHVDYHPNSNRANGQVEVHRLIYEARMNNLKFLEFIDILLNEPEKAKQLKYIDTDNYVIHHKDGCHYNNSIDNLQLITREEHSKMHSDIGNSYKSFSQGIPLWIPIKSISQLGIEDTYDIECEEPHHNFVANDIVVHNSGKSNSSIAEAYYFKLKTGRDIHLFFRLEKLLEFAKNNENKIIIWDEPALDSLSTDQMTTLNRNMLRLINTMRKKRHFLIINFTKFWRFSVDLVCDTILGMVCMDSRDGEHIGRFVYIRQKKLERLWDTYQKTRKKTYGKLKSFGGWMPEVMEKYFDKMGIFVEEVPNATLDDYERVKDRAIKEIGNQNKISKREQNTINRYNELRYRFAIYPGITQKEKAKILGVSARSIQDWAILPRNDTISLGKISFEEEEPNPYVNYGVKAEENQSSLEEKPGK